MLTDAVESINKKVKKGKGINKEIIKDRHLKVRGLRGIVGDEGGRRRRGEGTRCGELGGRGGATVASYASLQGLGTATPL